MVQHPHCPRSYGAGMQEDDKKKLDRKEHYPKTVGFGALIALIGLIGGAIVFLVYYLPTT